MPTHTSSLISRRLIIAGIFGALIAGILTYAPAQTASAQTYYTQTPTIAQLQAQIQMLIQQVALLQQLVDAQRGHGSYYDPYCDPYRYDRYCDPYTHRDDIRSIEVSFSGRMAHVRVEFYRGSTRNYALEARTEREVASQLSRELGISAYELERLIDRRYDDRYDDRDDIRSIDVVFSRDDAEVTVRFRNSSTSRFTIRNVYRSEREVVRELADRYNMRERDIERIIDFSGSDAHRDIRSIDVLFTRHDAEVTVRFRSGSTERFTIRNVSESTRRVIEHIADRYNMRERDVEDLIRFDYD